MRRALVVDTETTGLVPNATIKNDWLPEIVEVYAALVDFDADGGSTIVDELDQLVRPSRPIVEASRSGMTHGITNEMVRDAPAFRAVLPRLRKMIESAPVVVAHNATFDREVIDIEARRAGGAIVWPPLLCTIEQSIGLRGHRMSLGDLHEELTGMRFEGAHRAKVDVAALIRCIGELVRREML
ncbi:MAG TPA: 3'-5' exonuclease [Polyangia bacterium]|nr:3'-5' exonuclease [Polyangia bacterium]